MVTAAVPGACRARPGDASDSGHELVVDLDELGDHAGELPGDELLVRRRAGMRVIGSLVGKVLDEQQVVRLRRVTVDPELERARLQSWPAGRELRDDGLDLGLLAGLEIDREYLYQHEQLLWESEARYCASCGVHDPGAAAGCLATSGRIACWPNRLKEPCPDAASTGAVQHIYRAGDGLLGGGDDRDLLPARCGAKPLAENVRTFELAASAEAAGFRVPALPPVPGRWPHRVRGTRTRLPCHPADHRRCPGCRHRGLTRGSGWPSRRVTCGESSTSTWALPRISWPGPGVPTSPAARSLAWSQSPGGLPPDDQPRWRPWPRWPRRRASNSRPPSGSRCGWATTR
jgi:hypothetical protein